MKTVTMYDANNAVIIVNEEDISKYKTVGFGLKKNIPKTKSTEPIKDTVQTEKTDEEDKKRSKK